MNGHLKFLMYHTAPAHTRFDFHNHNCFELVYYIRGTGRMYIEQTPYDYKPQSLTLTRPHLMHDERHDEDTDVLFIGFDYDDDPKELRNGLYFDPAGTIYQLMLNMKQEMISAKAFQSHLMDLLVNQVVLELLRTESQSHRHFKNDKLVYAVRALDENYLYPINLGDLASVSGYSLDRFRHLFKEETGYSPLNYIFNKRLEYAQLLLRTTDQKISSIAMECAFSTPSQFCTMFKKRYVITPEEFRRNNRGAFSGS